MDRRFAAIVVVMVVIFGGLIFASNNKSSGTGSGSGTNSAIKPTNNVTGDGKKHVTLLQYGDFQCPACGAYYPIVKQITTEFNTDIYFQFRNFPLDSIHQNARAGARAAQAAADQGKFWEMHDKLYETQNDWAELSDPTTTFNTYAEGLGLNMKQFKSDYASDTTNGIINADITLGQKIGVDSTPTFVLDGVTITQNPRDLPSFEKLINDEIDKKNPGTHSTISSSNPDPTPVTTPSSTETKTGTNSQP